MLLHPSSTFYFYVIISSYIEFLTTTIIVKGLRFTFDKFLQFEIYSAITKSDETIGQE